MTIQLHNMKITDNIPQGYKNSPLGIIPQEWEVKKLGDITEINPSKEEISSQFVTFLTMSDVSEHGGVIKENIMPKSSIKPGLTSFKRGDIIIAKITPCFENGKGALLNNITCEYGFGSTEFHVIRYRQCNIFIYYHTMSYAFRKRLESQMTGSAGQKRVPADSISSYKIPVPSLSEQQKIAEILSTWDKAIEKQMQLIEKFELRKKGLMQQLLTGKKRLPGFSGEWKKVKFSSIIEKMSNGYVYDTNNTGDIPITRIETISKGNIDYSKVGFIQYVGELEKYKLRKGDILFSHINSIAHIGKVAMFDGNKDLYHGMNLLLIRAKEIINKIYLYYFLSSTIARRKVRSFAKQAVNQASVNTDELKKWILCIPEIEEQSAIAQILAETDQEIKFYQEKLKLLRQQERGLMQQLLTGKKRIKF